MAQQSSKPPTTMSVSAFRRRIPWLLLTVLVLASTNFVVWIWGHDLSTLESETTKHLLKSYEMYDLFQRGAWSEALNTRPYPPLFYLPAVAMYYLSGVRSESVALLSLLPFILLSTIGVYGLGRRLGLPTWECASAAFLCATYVSLRIPSAGYIIEYAVAPFVILAFWTLIASDFLSQRRYSLTFALCCGLGLLAKWTFIVYLILTLPLVLVLLWLQPTQRRNRAINLGLTLVAITLLALPWYGAHHYHGNNDDGNNIQEVLTYLEQSLDTDFAAIRQAQAGATTPETFGWPRDESPQTRDWGNIYIILFGKYVGQNVIPPHISALLVLGLGVFGFQAWRHPSERPRFWSLVLCPIFALSVFCTYPNIYYFNPEGSPLRYAGVLVPLASLFSLMVFPRLPFGRAILLAVFNLVTVVYAVGWVFPNDVTLYSSCWFRPTVCGTDNLEFADPCGCFTAPKVTALDRVAVQLDDYVSQGFQPALVVSVHQAYQPLFAHLYKRHHDMPVATYEGGRWQYLSCLSQQPIEPGAVWRNRPFIFLYQDHLRREDSPELLTRAFDDNCNLNSQNLGLVQRLLRFRILNSATALIAPRPNCYEVYYFSTHSPLEDPLLPNSAEREIQIPYQVNPLSPRYTSPTQ